MLMNECDALESNNTCWVGINGKHTSHHWFIMQDFLSLSEVDLPRAAYGHPFLDDHLLDQTGVS